MFSDPSVYSFYIAGRS